MKLPTVAVIGAGVAGLACARTLLQHGMAVSVFDKGRRPGGRISTRRRDGHAYDHGAQYLTARDPRFVRLVNMLQSEAVVAPWPARFVEFANGILTARAPQSEWLVGVPGMSALATSLAEDIQVRTGVQIARLDREKAGWRILAADGVSCGSFDAVIVAVPAPQALPLLASTAPRLAEAVAAVQFAPCWASMIALERPMPLAFDAATIKGAALAWIARNASKPGRVGGETWVLHAADEWSASHLEEDPANVAEALLVAFAEVTNVILTGVEDLQAHRWCHARVSKPVGQSFLFDEEEHIGACGDWCLGARIEAAFLSGTAMADALIAALPAVHHP